MGSPKEVILKILDIIEFTDDREKFADGILTLVYKKALDDCLATLPGNKQKALNDTLPKENTDPQVFSDALMQYITPDEFIKALEKSAKDIMDSYLKAIIPTINDDQKKQIGDYFSSGVVK